MLLAQREDARFLFIQRILQFARLVLCDLRRLGDRALGFVELQCDALLQCLHFGCGTLVLRMILSIALGEVSELALRAQQVRLHVLYQRIAQDVRRFFELAALQSLVHLLLPCLRLVHAGLGGNQLRADVGQPGVLDIELLVGGDDLLITLALRQTLLRCLQSGAQALHLFIEPRCLPPRRVQSQLEIGIDVRLGEGIRDLRRPLRIPCGKIDADHTAFARGPHIQIGEQIARERFPGENTPAFLVKKPSRLLGMFHELQVSDHFQCDVAAGDHIHLRGEIARQLLRLQLRAGDRVGILGADDHRRFGHIGLRQHQTHQRDHGHDQRENEEHESFAGPQNAAQLSEFHIGGS